MVKTFNNKEQEKAYNTVHDVVTRASQIALGGRLDSQFEKAGGINRESEPKDAELLDENSPEYLQ
mgnify:CR=1 FL=1